MDTQTLLDVLQIVVPAIMIAGGGAVAWWKYLQQREAEKDNFKVQADQAAWQRVQDTISRQADTISDHEAKIEKLEMTTMEQQVEITKSKNCIDKLEKEFGECKEDRERLKKENHVLEQEKATLTKLLREK